MPAFLRTCSLLAVACTLPAPSFASETPDATRARVPAPGNILLIIADDLGVDRVAAYGAHPDPGRTPNIDRLASNGLLFRNAWSTPLCSSSRSAMLTGRYGFRTGIGRAINETAGEVGLRLSELTLPEVLRQGADAAWTSAVIGKWHLGAVPQGWNHPRDSGFDAHAGSWANLFSSQPGVNAYSSWDKVVNGVPRASTTYATTDTVDDGIRAARNLPEPWFIWLAFNAPHRPYHAPPGHLHSFQLGGLPDATPIQHHKAMTEAMDTEIGRLLDSIPADRLSRTTILFVGDNGTQPEATQAPFIPGHGKGTVFEGGLNVPLIAVGPAVSQRGSECSALVSLTDLFATIADLAGVDAPAMAAAQGIRTDSISLLPYLAQPDLPSMRDVLYAENFRPNGFGPFQKYTRAVRDVRYKLVWRRALQGNRFFDLETDPLEQNDLLQGTLDAQQQAAYERLRRRLRQIAGS